MYKKYSLKEILVVMLAGLLLSGCSAGKGVRSKRTQQASVSGTIIQPLGKPAALIAASRVKASQRLPALPVNNYMLDQNKSLEIDISENGYTRFSIEDERITDVFIYPQEDVQVKIHQQGYLIILPKQLQENREEDGFSKDSIYVTVTGENGTTQDFSLRFTGKAPEPVKFVKVGLGKLNLK